MSGKPSASNRKTERNAESTKINRQKSGSEKVDGKTRKSVKSEKEDPPAGAALIKTKSDKSLTSKGDKSTKKRGRSTKDYSKKKGQQDNKKKGRRKDKTFFEKIAGSFGFYVGIVTLSDPRAIEASQALDLQPWHLRRLKQRFDQIDIDGSGAIDFDEFFEAIGEIRSPFTDKLFALIDLDGSGTIEFDEYVRVLATYCMFTKDEILRFCFECFDVDRSGTIDEKEFIELCKCINNAAPSFPSNFKKALEEFDVNEDGLIDYSEFLELDRRYPLMLFPAFRLQDVMQRTSLGEKVWLQVMEKYQEVKRIEEYKAAHGGRAPPDTPVQVFLKTFLPCFFREKIHIAVGSAMEKRHRDE